MEFLADVGIFPITACRALLVAHLFVSVLALGLVSHHFLLVVRGTAAAGRLARYARWMAIAYPLAWLGGILIYPSYNVLIRKPPLGVLEQTARWAVGLFEIKEHLGTLALAMLPWLVISAYRSDLLSRAERVGYVVATWVFTLFVYYVFAAGALVASVKSY